MIDKLIENLPMLIAAIATVGIVRSYMKKLLALNKEVMELQNAIVEAMEDDKITKEELERIKKEAQDIPGAVKKCIEPLKKLWNKIFRR